MNNKYDTYKELLCRIADVNYAMGLQGWDQETYMPEKGSNGRARQMATLSGIAHSMVIDKNFGKLLKSLNKNPKGLSEKQKRNVAQSNKDYKKLKKYPTEFVELLNKTSSESFNAWQKAKKENSFEIFSPYLKKMVKLKRKEAEILGYKKHPYNALLDLYEPGSNVGQLEPLFKDVKSKLGGFIKKVSHGAKVNDAFMFLHYPKDKQWDFGIELLKQMHFNFNAGRQDISSHPFTTSFNALDVRLTTRISEDNLKSMLWSCIHEGGHGLYEQGLPAEEYGLPSGEAISLGIHESQSRLWENMVGRGLPFWKHNITLARRYFPENLKDVSAEEFYNAANVVAPSLIRTEADELTYHFHVIIRYEIEKGLLDNSISIKELPDVWNSKYKEYLGLKVPSDSKGILQDVHWSHGSFGYFPTYSLGSFYAAQFYSQAKTEIEHLENKIEQGNLLPLLQWLRLKIHRYGKYYSAAELCKKVTGSTLDISYFIDYAKKKYTAIHTN